MKIQKTLALVAILLFFGTLSIQAQWVAKEKNDKYGYVDSKGKVMIPYQYPFVYTDTLNTIAFVAIEHGGIKAIDKDNNQLFTPFIYDNGPDYEEEGVFRIIDDTTQKMGFANMEGQIVIPSTFDFVTPFSEGLAAFNEGGKQVRDTDGDGHTMTVGGKWGFIDREGNIVFPAIFDSAWGFENGKVNVSIAGRIFTLSVDK